MKKRDKTIKEIEFTPETLRRMQLIQLEILTELDRICKKHDIKYSMDGGTLLGAVRHGGFIPWDDDVDVIMTRVEYERFFEICGTELDESRFFLQEHRTDSHYRVGYTRIRRRNTIYVRAGQEDMKHRTGVLIDVFVLDNVPDAKALRYAHRFLCFCFRKILWSATGKIVSPNPLLRTVYAVVSLIPADFAFWGFDMLARTCNKRKTRIVRHNAMTYPNPKRNGFGTPEDFMDAFTELEFEGRMFMAVADYDGYLSLLYGDYMTPPPPEERTTHIRLSAFAPVGGIVTVSHGNQGMAAPPERML
jgi:lipopolysaccharide cholinephosphotransferase